ncbi:cysteine-rich and transmembrane domain-containing protein WIH2-like [Oryza brachyantha]|uniref:Cysteine-rich transmembrane domain-containing protein n=1 Tax=Oryza brachyantha TaxID=4533 RepID=J3MR74_ORYBR|nr:cysteine-rich and transmembrane domain-containing protein WIH2-like [Oryza brachyantha]
MSYQAPPPSTTGYPAQATQQQAYPVYVAPPPAGYPTREQEQYPAGAGAGASETRSRGHGHHHGGGFWRGCCAALCCCCLLDMCF